MTEADVNNPELKNSSSGNGSHIVRDSSVSISANDVGQELSWDDNRSDLVQSPAIRERGFIITGWKTMPGTPGSVRKGLGPNEYPLIVATSHVGEALYVTIMFVTKENLSYGRSILPITCNICGTLLIRNHHKELDFCLRCNREKWPSNKPPDDSDSYQLGRDDYYQFVEWPSEISGKEQSRLVSFPIHCLRDRGTALLSNRCPDCRCHLMIFQGRPSCLWCGKTIPLEIDVLRVAYRITLSDSDHASVTFHKGRASKTWTT